jgi:hypothetical protein
MGIAQQRFGNHFVRDAVSHASMAAPVGALDGTTKTGGVGQEGPLAKSGVHGEGLGGMVKTAGPEDKHTVTTIGKFGGADDMRYGDTFGGGRMAGDGTQINGELAKLGGNRRGATDDDRGTTSLPGSKPGGGMGGGPIICTTPTAGQPSPVAYPGAGGPTPAGSEKKNDSNIPSSNGNDAGTIGGVADSTTKPGGTSSTGNVVLPSFLGGGNSTPTDDVDTGGTGAPVVVNRAQQAAGQNLINHQRDAHKNVTDGGDGRGETGSPSGGTSGIGVMQRDKVDGKVEHEQGTLDLDKALQINQVVNPGRT